MYLGGRGAVAGATARPAGLDSSKDIGALVAMVRICAYYQANGCWLEEGQLVREVGQLTGIPGVLIHGRLDLSCPFDPAWEPARGWPDAELVGLADSGHLGRPSRWEAQLAALDSFAGR